MGVNADPPVSPASKCDANCMALGQAPYCYIIYVIHWYATVFLYTYIILILINSFTLKNNICNTISSHCIAIWVYN